MRSPEQVTIVEEQLIAESAPTIPSSPMVNIEQLTATDRARGEEPLFINLPLGHRNQVSANRRRYVDDVALKAIYNAIMDARVTGNAGHTAPFEFGFEFPLLHWVGALIEDGIVWGKAYVLGDTPRQREARSYYQAQAAKNAKVGTSIQGRGAQTFNDELNIWDVTDLIVDRIDIVGPHEVGIALAGSMQPIITTESQTQNQGANAPMSESMTATPTGESTQMTDLREQNARLQAQVQVLDAILQVLEDNSLNASNPAATIRELCSDVAAIRAEQASLLEVAIEQAIGEAAPLLRDAQASGGNAARFASEVTTMIRNRIGAVETKASIQPAVSSVIHDDGITVMLETLRKVVMGPAQSAPVTAPDDRQGLGANTY